ncbi:MAG TPA: hypothetical protein DCM40_05550, partial [Maribacter sp.]|nr:hypothetical protein [Maribacter sp.]
TDLLQKLNNMFEMDFQHTHEKPFISRNDNENLYSLETIELFLGKDKTAIDEVLLTFKNDTGKNLHELKLAVATNNITQINSTTHRMLPM